MLYFIKLLIMSHNIYSFIYEGDVSVVEKELKKAIIESFRKTDDEFLKEAKKRYVIYYVNLSNIL